MKRLGHLARLIPVRAAVVVVLVAIVAGAVLIARIMDDTPSTTTPVTAPRPADTAAHLTAAPAVQPSSGVQQSHPAEPHDHHDDGVQDFPVAPSQPAVAAATTTVTGFAAAWVRRDVPADQWWTAVSGYCEPGFADRLRSTDPGTVPAGRITGPATPVISRAGLAVYQVPTSAGVLHVQVALLGGTWKVTTTDWRRS